MLFEQWNLSNPDTNGAEVISEVSSFQRLKCMQECHVLGVEKMPYLVLEFQGSGIEKFHCTTYKMHTNQPPTAIRLFAQKGEKLSA